MCIFTELQKISNNFRGDLTELFDIAHSFVAMASIGSEQICESLKNDSDFSYKFCIPFSTNQKISFVELNDLKYSKMLEIYFAHKQIILELVYARIIQRWYDFLNKIFEQILTENITNIKTYPKLPKIKIEIDCNSENFLQKIPKLICESFDFYTPKEKIKVIETSLERELTKEIKDAIKVAVTVRNLLEHHKGIIRDKDVLSLGSRSIRLTKDSIEEEDFLPGDKIEISIYELFKLKNVLDDAAIQLIPWKM